MRFLSTQRFPALVLVGFTAVSVGVAAAATGSIGVAVSSGNVTVNNSLVPGNATLFDGNVVETGSAASRLQLKSGKLVQLGSDSRGAVYSNRLVLEKGSSETGGAFEVDARSLRIEGGASRVAVAGKTVQVAALISPVSVSTSTGVRLANLMPGRALAFTPQDSGATLAPATLTGWVRKVGENYLLMDVTSNVTVQLVGGGVEKDAKKFVRVTGTPASGSTPAEGAAQVLNVTNIEVLPKPAKGTPGAVMIGSDEGASRATYVLVGIAFAAGLGATAGVLATQGDNGTSVSLSPGR